MLNKLKTVIRDIRVNRGGRRTNRQAEFVPLILRRLGRATIIQHHQWHRPVFLRLQINRPAVTMALPIDQRTQYSTLTVLQQVNRRDEVIERIVRRQIRLEAGAAPSDQPVGNRALTGVPPPPVSPPMILRTPPPAPVVANAAPAASVAVDSPRIQTRPAKLDVDAIDMNRLTEQVVTAIDRRISAWRERTGRH